VVLLALSGACDALMVPTAMVRPCGQRARRTGLPLSMAGEDAKQGFFGGLTALATPKAKEEAAAEASEEEWTLDKVASLGLAGVLSIAVAESVFWILSFPLSELLYFASTGEWINLLEQEGQLKFLAFSAGWGALGGVIAQYRTVLTAAAMTPWMDANVVQPYLTPLIEQFKSGDSE